MAELATSSRRGRFRWQEPCCGVRKGQVQHCRTSLPSQYATDVMQELANEAAAVLQLPEVLAAAAFTLSVSR